MLALSFCAKAALRCESIPGFRRAFSALLRRRLGLGDAGACSSSSVRSVRSLSSAVAISTSTCLPFPVFWLGVADTFLVRCLVAGGEGSEDEACEADGDDLAVEVFDLADQSSIADALHFAVSESAYLTPRLLYLAMAVLSFVLN